MRRQKSYCRGVFGPQTMRIEKALLDCKIQEGRSDLLRDGFRVTCKEGLELGPASGTHDLLETSQDRRVGGVPF